MRKEEVGTQIKYFRNVKFIVWAGVCRIFGGNLKRRIKIWTPYVVCTVKSDMTSSEKCAHSYLFSQRLKRV